MTFRKLSMTLSLIIGLTFIAKGGFIHIKAAVAQHLLEHAWTFSSQTQQAQKPWPWADTRAIARLSAPSTDTRIIVLEGLSGEAMAFGPGLQNITPSTGTSNLLIGGHRDTHMTFMKDLKYGDELYLETLDGSINNYHIEEMFIANTDTETLQVDPQSNSLILVTCYPFDALVAGGPLRYVVVAQEG